MPAKFQHINREDFKLVLFQRLGDTSETFWTNSEADVLINEALHTFGGIAQSWKEQVEIKINIGNSFYNITTDLVVNQQLLAFTQTYQDILNQINFHLMEDISNVSPVSAITSLEEIRKFAVNRINEFHYKTQLIISQQTIAMPAVPLNKIILEDDVINIIRATFTEFDELENPFKTYKLRKEDERALATSDYSLFQTQGRPKFYTTVEGNLNEVWIYPKPSNLGQLEFLLIKGANDLLTINLSNFLSTIVNLPNNLVHYIKYGILADIFSKDGIGYDAARAAYCMSRWEEGVLIGVNYTSILLTYLNGKPILLDSISNIDNENSQWQNQTGKPSIIGLAGYNLLTTNKMPNDEYSLLIDSNVNAYLPVSDVDFIDVRPEYIEGLLDYCIHLASIKDGAAAIKNTITMKDNFIKTAISNNIRLHKRGLSYEILMKQTKREAAEDRIIDEAA